MLTEAEHGRRIGEQEVGVRTRRASERRQDDGQARAHACRRRARDREGRLRIRDEEAVVDGAAQARAGEAPDGDVQGLHADGRHFDDLELLAAEGGHFAVDVWLRGGREARGGRRQEGNARRRRACTSASKFGTGLRK